MRLKGVFFRAVWSQGFKNILPNLSCGSMGVFLSKMFADARKKIYKHTRMCVCPHKSCAWIHFTWVIGDTQRNVCTCLKVITAAWKSKANRRVSESTVIPTLWATPRFSVRAGNNYRWPIQLRNYKSIKLFAKSFLKEKSNFVGCCQVSQEPRKRCARTEFFGRTAKRSVRITGKE